MPPRRWRSGLTQVGTIVGTPEYMSKEQVEGNETDARSDIFSVGAVLYELITGKKAFEGKSAASVMAAVLRETPAPMTARDLKHALEDMGAGAAPAGYQPAEARPTLLVNQFCDPR